MAINGTESLHGGQDVVDANTQVEVGHSSGLRFSIASRDFWQQLQTDLQRMPYEKLTLRRFLTHADPDTNPFGGADNVIGKYISIYNTDDEVEDPLITEYAIVLGFVPPQEDAEFVQVVSQARALIADRLQVPQRRFFELVSDYAFWNNFRQDFQMYHMPTLDYFKSHFAMGKGGIELFYKEAPTDIKLLLSASFPQTFDLPEEEEVFRDELIPSEVKPLIEATFSVSADSQNVIIDAAVEYVYAKHEAQGNTPYDKRALLKMIRRIADGVPIEERSVTSSIEELVEQSKDFFTVLTTITPDTQPALSQTSEALVTTLTEHYFSPICHSLLYKPVTVYWRRYLEAHPEALTVPSDIFRSFLLGYTEAAFARADAGDDVDRVMAFLASDVFPVVYDDFVEPAEFAPTIQRFKPVDENGQPKRLFYHQVDTIYRYSQNIGGGILTSEPGTGKTVELALSALEQLDKRELQGQAGRILVVGSRSVIDNWQSELQKHIDLEGINVINLNYGQDEHIESKSVSERIKSAAAAMGESTNGVQFLLANYDMFRNKQFKQMLAKHGIAVTIIDEAHNVKSRMLESVIRDAIVETHGRRTVARRTKGLYSYIQDHPEMSVFIATSTPFVKELIEPLIMAHLANQKAVPISLIELLQNDIAGTSQLLRSLMIRHRKDQVAEIPPMVTEFTPIDLSTLPDEMQVNFMQMGEAILESDNSPLSKFYALLSLEAQAKIPWLIDKVEELIAQGKKFVIFTPFVSDENRLTASISTRAIAKTLHDAGITDIGILDGSVDDADRLAVQKSFHAKDGIKGLVGNYLTAGESLTLNSPENHATEIIPFVCPNAISRYMQAINRVHRIGQEEVVTVHVPYVVGDLLGRLRTHDERVVMRLLMELKVFDAVVDGLFFMEAKDFYQDIADRERLKIGDSQERTFGKRRRQKAERKVVNYEEIDTAWLENEQTIITLLQKESPEYWESLKDLLTRIRHYPVFSKEVEYFIFSEFDRGTTLEILLQNPQFQELIPAEERERYLSLVRDSENLDAFIVNANLRLAFSIARKYQGRGLPLEDLFQEATFGLMKARDMFDVTMGWKYSTYATFWVSQSVGRAIRNIGTTVRMPVHVHDDLYHIQKLLSTYRRDNEDQIPDEEFRRMLTDNLTLSTEKIEFYVKHYRRLISHVVSLSQPLFPDSDTVLQDTIVDEGIDVEEIGIAQDVAARVHAELDTYTARERFIIKQRFGLTDHKSHILQELADALGISRERVRQIEGEVLDSLRRSPDMRSLWEDTSSSGFRLSVSAEDAAFAAGLFKDE